MIETSSYRLKPTGSWDIDTVEDPNIISTWDVETDDPRETTESYPAGPNAFERRLDRIVYSWARQQTWLNESNSVNRYAYRFDISEVPPELEWATLVAAESTEGRTKLEGKNGERWCHSSVNLEYDHEKSGYKVEAKTRLVLPPSFSRVEFAKIVAKVRPPEGACRVMFGGLDGSNEPGKGQDVAHVYIPHGAHPTVFLDFLAALKKAVEQNGATLDQHSTTP